MTIGMADDFGILSGARRLFKLQPQAVRVESEMPSPEIENPQCSPRAAGANRLWSSGIGPMFNADGLGGETTVDARLPKNKELARVPKTKGKFIASFRNKQVTHYVGF